MWNAGDSNMTIIMVMIKITIVLILVKKILKY